MSDHNDDDDDDELSGETEPRKNGSVRVVRCPVDGVEFETQRSDARYCSPACRALASRDRRAGRKAPEKTTAPPRVAPTRNDCDNTNNRGSDDRSHSDGGDGGGSDHRVTSSKLASVDWRRRYEANSTAPR